MADRDAREQLDLRGVKTLSPAEALTGMDQLLAGSVANGVVARPALGAVPSGLSVAAATVVSGEARARGAAAGGCADAVRKLTGLFVDQLTRPPIEQRKRLVLDHVRGALAEITRIDPVEIRDDAGFFDLGMDSLMAIELRRRLEQGFGRELPVTLAMDHPRLSDAADYLLGDILGLQEQAPTAAESTGGADRRADRDRQWLDAHSRCTRSGKRSGIRCRTESTRFAIFWTTASTSTSTTTLIQTSLARFTAAAADSSRASTD